MQQLERWMRVTYFCQYCGYEFAEAPKLPTKCPRCGRILREFGEPVIVLAQPAQESAKRRNEKRGD